MELIAVLKVENESLKSRLKLQEEKFYQEPFHGGNCVIVISEDIFRFWVKL